MHVAIMGLMRILDALLPIISEVKLILILDQLYLSVSSSRRTGLSSLLDILIIDKTDRLWLDWKFQKPVEIDLESK